MAQVFAISVTINGYKRVIYVNANQVKVTKLCPFGELEESEQEMFGNTDLGNEFAAFDWESLD
jgi:hypothetical protein